jgi:hypothetical protein
VLSRERYDVVEASLDKDKIPAGIGDYLIVLGPLLAGSGSGLSEGGPPQNGRATSCSFPAQAGPAHFVTGQPRSTRRRTRSVPDSIQLGDRSVALSTRVVQTGAEERRLTRLECAILSQLLAHVNHTVPSVELVRKLWPSDVSKGVHSLRAFIKNLRKKIEPDPARPQYVLTDLAVGYRLSLPQPRREQ